MSLTGLSRVNFFIEYSEKDDFTESYKSDDIVMLTFNLKNCKIASFKNS